MSMKPQEICNAMYGLQGMDSRHPEVLSVLRELNKRLAVRQRARGEQRMSGNSSSKRLPTPFTAQGIGNALSGLQSMSFKDGVEVSEVLGYLADELEACVEVMKAQDIANALFGIP
jgi:hypothetical protein